MMQATRFAVVAAAFAASGLVGITQEQETAGPFGPWGDRFSAWLLPAYVVPAVSSPGAWGKLRATLDPNEDALHYELSYSGIQGHRATMAHVHFAQPNVNGQIVTWLCAEPGRPEPVPPDTQLCPQSNENSDTISRRITGTIRAENIIGTQTVQGLIAGEFDEFVAALRDGLMYVDVHSVSRAYGEIRGQIERHPRRRSTADPSALWQRDYE